MRAVRFIIAMFVVLGLSMSTARAMVATGSAPAMEDCEGTIAMGGEDCPCCDADAKCSANVCAMTCLKMVSNAPAVLIVRHLSGLLLALPTETDMQGLCRPPPAPPPRT
jgi:hypothetical protein